MRLHLLSIEVMTPDTPERFCLCHNAELQGVIVTGSQIASRQRKRHLIKDSLIYLGELSMLLFETLRWLASPRSWHWQRIFTQLVRVGWSSLPVVALLSFTIGMAVAFQAAYQLGKFSFPSPIYTASFSTLMVFREIGPVLTALLIAGRIGASMTAEIGTMQITQQIDALRALATNPVRYLVVPRFLALLVGLPILTLYADFIGVLGGYAIGTTQLQIGPQLYLEMANQFIGLKDIWTGLLKALCFAIIIAIVACHQGFRTQMGAEGVAQATTRSVVASFLLIIAADSIITALFYFMGK